MSKILSKIKKKKKIIIFSFLIITFLAYLKIPLSSWLKNDNFFDTKNVYINTWTENDLLFKKYLDNLEKNKNNFSYNSLKYKCLKENNFKKLDFKNLWDSKYCNKLNNFLNNDEYKEKLNEFLEDNYELDEDFIKDNIKSLEKYKTNFELEKNNILIKESFWVEKIFFEKIKDIFSKNKSKKIIINCKNSNFNNLISFEQAKNSYILEKINNWDKSQAIILLINNIKNNSFLINNIELNLINFLTINTLITTNLESLEYFLTKKDLSEIQKKIIIKLLKRIKIDKKVFQNILKKEFEKKLNHLEKTDIIKEITNWKDFSEKLKIEVESFLFYNKQETEELLRKKYKKIVQNGSYENNEINSLLNIRNYFWKNIVLSEKKCYKKEFKKIENNNILIDRIINKLKK